MVSQETPSEPPPKGGGFGHRNVRLFVFVGDDLDLDVAALEQRDDLVELGVRGLGLVDQRLELRALIGNLGHGHRLSRRKDQVSEQDRLDGQNGVENFR